MDRLKKLDHRHKAACRMRVAGKPNSEIAEAVGAKERTLHLWWSDELIQEYLQDLAENVEREFAQEIARASLVAMNQLTEMMGMGTDDATLSVHEKLEVAREILDRNPHLAKIRDRAAAQAAAGGAEGGMVNYLAVFQNMPDERVVEFLNSWRNSASSNGQSSIEGTTSGD